MRLPLWPQSLFGRLIAASVIALLLGEIASLALVARERDRFILQTSVREWSRRIAEVTYLLQGLDPAQRASATARLAEAPWGFAQRSPNLLVFRDRNPIGPPGMGALGPAHGLAQVGALGTGPPGEREESWRRTLLPSISFQTAADFESAFEQQLRATLGPGFQVKVSPTIDSSKHAILMSAPQFAEVHDAGLRLYDAAVRFPDGYDALFRVAHLTRGPPLPRNLFLNLTLLVVVMVVALFVTARSITRPLSELARAADSVGRDLRQPKLAEKGARELRDAARAFNTMQDRLHRYLDSRSRVLAAMSHDLKTPLTRLRLQVETLDDPAIQARFSRQLDEMESMVHGALALFRGLDDSEAFAPLDIDAMLATLKSEFAEMGAEVTVEGRASRSILGKPQALRRCLTNLIANAIKFGSRANVGVEDGPALIVRVLDEGPGVPDQELERVFEPFYRLESSRNRDTGGTGLGLSIARDVAQAHGGTLILRNLPVRGLEAVLTLPRK